MVSEMNDDGEIVGECYICGKKCDFLRNCKNVDCNLFYISCLDCEKEFSKCCSEKCAEKFKMGRENFTKLVF
jgi:predicted sulfurtransferase